MKWQVSLCDILISSAIINLYIDWLRELCVFVLAYHCLGCCVVKRLLFPMLCGILVWDRPEIPCLFSSLFFSVINIYSHGKLLSKESRYRKNTYKTQNFSSWVGGEQIFVDLMVICSTKLGGVVCHEFLCNTFLSEMGFFSLGPLTLMAWQRMEWDLLSTLLQQLSVLQAELLSWLADTLSDQVGPLSNGLLQLV